jgi:hypothetical protein
MTKKKCISKQDLEIELIRLRTRIREGLNTENEIENLAGSIVTVKKFLELLK